MTELQNLLEALLGSYISGFQVDGRIPYELREKFERDMEKTPKNLSLELSEKYQSALNSGNTPEEAMEKAQVALKEGMGTISAKLHRYGKDFKALVPLLLYRDEGYDMFLFLSEQGENTCERCERHQSKVYSIYDLHREGAIPPLHPNCCCELIAMDGFGVRLYNTNRHIFLQYFERLRGKNNGGIYVLDHDFLGIGLSPEALTRISYPSGALAVDPDKPWSLEHLLDIVGTVLIAYAAFRTASKAARAVGGVDDVLNLKPKELMRELANSGEKVSVDAVVAVTRTADGKLVWLETGTEGAGLKHIISRHASQFADKGISAEDIPEFLFTALKSGRVIGKQNTRDVFEVEFHGVIQRVSISIGSNGFIVGANPVSNS